VQLNIQRPRVRDRHGRVQHSIAQQSLKRLSKKIRAGLHFVLKHDGAIRTYEIGKSGSKRWRRSVAARARLAISPKIRMRTQGAYAVAIGHGFKR
jgi:hypothetical protein